jgi:GntR family transcriptional regulator
MPDDRSGAVAGAGGGPAGGGAPLYAKIADELRGQITSGYYGPGALLPSRNELAAAYGVSTITASSALAVLSHEGYARAHRGRGHIVRRKRPRLTVPARLYDPAAAAAGTVLDPSALALQHAEVYREAVPDNIALPLECGGEHAWVRRAVHTATADGQCVQIHVSWLPGLPDGAGDALRGLDPALAWPQAVQRVTGRTVASVAQHTRARGANPFEAGCFGLTSGTAVLVSHLTTCDPAGRPVEHSRYAWPTDAVRMSDHYPHAP